MIDILFIDEVKLLVVKKVVLLYYNLGVNEGLQLNFFKIVNDYKVLFNSVVIVESILDMLFYGIIDFKIQWFVFGVVW